MAENFIPFGLYHYIYLKAIFWTVMTLFCEFVMNANKSICFVLDEI